MRRTFWSRLVAGWLACWLPLVLADGAWMHACPMHDGAGGGAATMAPMAQHASHTTPHADAHSAIHAAHGATHPRHAAGHVCGCLRACCAASAALAPRAPTLLVAAETRVTTPAAPSAAPVSYRPTAPEHARPPSVGPPAPRTA